jgi:pilus assembly protein CpaE
VIVAVLWQVGLSALTYVWTGQAASGAARAVAMGEPLDRVRDAAEENIPAAYRGTMVVRLDAADPSEVQVRVPIPAVFPGVYATSWDAVSTSHVVREP